MTTPLEQEYAKTDKLIATMKMRAAAALNDASRLGAALDLLQAENRRLREAWKRARELQRYRCITEPTGYGGAAMTDIADDRGEWVSWDDLEVIINEALEENHE